MIGDMAKLELPPENFDLVWSEGALYNIGIENACVCATGYCAPAANSLHRRAV